jgi:leader peptidase (prepilin peptidase)/N-methyltransferase
MTISLYVIFILAGLAIGSFLNVCIDRLPARKSIVSPPSHCDSCGKALTAIDNIPIVSYLWLRGRCRYCGARIPIRVLIVEVLTGVLFGLSFWRYGLTPQFGITAFWSCIFLLIIFIDLEHQLILNKITYPAAVIALILLGIGSLFPKSGIFGNFEMFPHPNILSGLLAAGICFIFFMIVFLINQKGLGMGDIKMVTLIGLAAGFPLGIVALFIGIVVGGIAAVILLLARKKGRKDVMPYGVFLGIGPIVALLWGNYIIDWYRAVFKI